MHRQCTIANCNGQKCHHFDDKRKYGLVKIANFWSLLSATLEIGTIGPNIASIYAKTLSHTNKLLCPHTSGTTNKTHYVNGALTARAMEIPSITFWRVLPNSQIFIEKQSNTTTV